ncbi:hypothetical protein PPACK8108_LOCUS4261 [Phakopsora pachyrhizi]|uniref:Uncharacterized protein n=1 Tax=Phakopsora pachyrhizi TaxID=170000 RepID=A0AAV0APD1_PHAPC|nr:hypothetical protein PPACK8108_LOCUS4261 [Phakopsora pachyrhizi]
MTIKEAVISKSIKQSMKSLPRRGLKETRKIAETGAIKSKEGIPIGEELEKRQDIKDSETNGEEGFSQDNLTRPQVLKLNRVFD